MIIVCTVLVAKTWRVNNNNKNKRLPNKELIVPPGTCDTTVSPNGRVYVKYYDYEFYPLYMVYYRRRPEHVPLSRYYNISNNIKKKGAAMVVQQQQRYPSAETETWQREQEERERRQKEEQLQLHRDAVRKQQERRLQEQQDEQKRLWQRQQAERLRLEQLALSERRRQEQAYGSGGRRQSNGNVRNKESCFIL